MAKPRKKVLVQMLAHGNIQIYVDNPALAWEEIRGIEGLGQSVIIHGNLIMARADPRYDTQEVADEIEALLTAEAPGSFKDAFREEGDLRGP